jgi:hypothetical protein
MSLANQTSVSPNWLPQVSAPFVYILKGLDDSKIPYENVSVPIGELKPLQGIVDYDKVNSMIKSIQSGEDSLKTIWISQDNEILDGHHRYVAAMKMNPESSISCMRIMAPHKDAIRILNKLGDLYDAKLQGQPAPEEDVLKPTDEITPEVENIEPVQSAGAMDQPEKAPKGGAITLHGYRQEPVKEKAVSGNFFHLQPKEGFKKFEIDFDNLLDTKSTGLGLNHMNPIIEFCKQWCQVEDLDILAGKHGVPVDKFAAKMIADKAKGMGYDGIKYGDIILQAF